MGEKPTCRVAFSVAFCLFLCFDLWQSKWKTLTYTNKRWWIATEIWLPFLTETYMQNKESVLWKVVGKLLWQLNQMLGYTIRYIDMRRGFRSFTGVKTCHCPPLTLLLQINHGENKIDVLFLPCIDVLSWFNWSNMWKMGQFCASSV